MEFSFNSCTLLIQLLHGLCTTFPWSSCDLVMWCYLTVTLWHLVAWYFLTLHPCIVSPEKKRKGKEIYIWLKVKRYVLKVYNNKLLEHSQYSLQFSSAAVNIFFFLSSLCCYPKNINIVGEMLVVHSFSNRYVSLKFWRRVVKESIQSRNVRPASTWSLQKSILVTWFHLY